MAETRTPRSGFVTGLAWVFIVLGAFGTLITLLQNIMIAVLFPIDEMRGAMQEAQKHEDIPAAARFMFRHFYLFFVLAFAASAATLVSAIGLLRRWNWARLVFIGMMALAVLWNLTCLAVPFLMPSPPIPDGAPPDFNDTFRLMWSIMTWVTVIMGLAFAGLFVWIIKRLTSAEIRREFIPLQDLAK